MTSDRSSKLRALAERTRLAALAANRRGARESLGQFFTPIRAATLIASMPRLPDTGTIRVLDPGAGSGILTAALVARILEQRPRLEARIVAVEYDRSLRPYLATTLDACADSGNGQVHTELLELDYTATGHHNDSRLSDFDIIIQNPPYAKLAASSTVRSAIRAVGADAPNLYAAFLTLAANALNCGGQLVAITPRSFCNGPYFDTFRRYLLDRIALDRLHVFDSRSTVFADTGVLQENIVFSGTAHGDRATVTLSVSNNHEDTPVDRSVPYTDVVHPADPHRFIRIITDDSGPQLAKLFASLPDTLTSLGITVSTGRVVDFRSRECLSNEPTVAGVPLIYPGNIRGGLVRWPREIRKPQWFAPHTDRDNTMMMPDGWYCVVKRFSAKEERRRVVAAVWSPVDSPNYEPPPLPKETIGPVAFENHLNVFHSSGTGLRPELAIGLSAWLNSSLVDNYFRTFSGHTQVNATDLRSLRFPDEPSLHRLGEAATTDVPEQEKLDRIVEDVIAGLRIVV